MHWWSRDIGHKPSARGAFQAGLIGDAGGFGRDFFGIAGFLPVVFLPDPGEGGDGEESTVFVNLTDLYFCDLYRISTGRESSAAKRLFHKVFPACPGIIRQISRRGCIPNGIRKSDDANSAASRQLIQISR
jgi:hypothetical protein